jgi:hypothetical protein
MQREELRRVVEGPAAVKVMRFESRELIDRLVDDVLQMPGALPLLSALSEMYLRYVERAPGDRTLTLADLEALGGGVTGSLQVRANALLAELDPAARMTARRVRERLVSIEGGNSRVGGSANTTSRLLTFWRQAARSMSYAHLPTRGWW